jgi:hypothetical protein
MSGSDLNDISESSVIVINVDSGSGSNVNTAATICNGIHKFDNGFHIYCSGAANLLPSTARLDISVLNPN